MLPDAFLLAVSDIILADPAAAAIAPPPVTDVTQMVQPLSKATTIAVFVVGVIPFAIATYEFWRHIAVGASFGTNDPVVFFIGQDDTPTSSRGRQVLGRDSLVTAYLIFAVVIAVLGLVLFSVATSPDPADFMVQQQQQQQQQI
jgi:hypothetical protein